MSKAKIHQALDLNILKQYAVVTTILFVMLAIYTIASLPAGGLFQALAETSLQSMSTFLFILVLATSFMGAIFHHTIKFRPRTRNAFAFVFSMSTLKFLGTIALFQVLGF